LSCRSYDEVLNQGYKMFEPEQSRVSFPELEQDIIRFWKEKRIFERSVEQRENGDLFILYEGPPTANASPGVHHILSRVFKDVIPRYKAMKGYRAPRKAGWDTHGLPVELSIEKELGFSSKEDIETYGVAEFNKRCRESVFRYVEEWNHLTERIGFWVDTEKAYKTLEPSYIESCWWIIKQLWDKGLIYQGYKVTPHCPRCGTSLSSHEVALGYQEDTPDPSVYIKFKVIPSLTPENKGQKRLNELLKEHKSVYLLAWTTTPWTLPGNTALAVAPEAEYVVVKKDDEYIILASALLEQAGLNDCEVVERLKGDDLATINGVNYEPLYNPHQFGIERRRFDERGALVLQESRDGLQYKVIAADFVSMEDGTGIVHIAPAFGEDDFKVGMHPDHCLDFVRDYVGLDGVIQGTYPFAGKFVKDADPMILEDLQSRGLLYRSETIRHTYPFCWRCATPLLYYAKPSWYIKTTARKDRLISGNEEINWYPEHIKHGRFGDWLENNVDWAFSRERYWGTPLPVWRCENCGADECIGSWQELGERTSDESMPKLIAKRIDARELDLHRPYIDDIMIDCSECGGIKKRVPDVLDAWFDSGAMPVASWEHDLHEMSVEQAERMLRGNHQFPADYICEAVDQTRGWFYTLHAISILLFDQPCYRNVICLGHILDAEGEKMSKSKGNVVQPAEVIDKHGADALRWYLLTSSPAGNPRRFSTELVGEAQRRFLSTLWNVYSFFVTYANIDKYDPGKAADVPCEAELDRWIISDLNQLIADVDRALEGYNPTEAGRRIQEFVEDLSNWYVRRSRRRFWKSESDADKLSAYATLYQCLVTISKLLAPLTPFIAEAMYRNLVCPCYPDAPESVHLADFPTADMSKVDERLSEDIHLVMKVCSLGRSARSKAGIKVRQPLLRVLVKARSKGDKEGIERLKNSILEELNVKAVEFVDSIGDYCYVEVESNVDLETSDDSRLHKKGIIDLHPDFDPKDFVFKVKKGHQTLAPASTFDYVGKAGYSVAHEGGYFIAIDTEVTPELEDEGTAREIVHRLQSMRKNAGFDIADYITTFYQRGETIDRVLDKWGDYIRRETLSTELVEGIPGDAYSESHKIAKEQMVLGVKRNA
jgi:isoleucyl-tRNA synthetase